MERLYNGGLFPNGWPFQKNHVTKHKAGLQRTIFFGVLIAVLHFLLKRRKEKIKAVTLIEIQQVRLVVGIHNKVTATRLITWRSEPIHNKINNHPGVPCGTNFKSTIFMIEVWVNVQSSPCICLQNRLSIRSHANIWHCSRIAL